jgi:hypothetical protein
MNQSNNTPGPPIINKYRATPTLCRVVHRQHALEVRPVVALDERRQDTPEHVVGDRPRREPPRGLREHRRVAVARRGRQHGRAQHRVQVRLAGNGVPPKAREGRREERQHERGERRGAAVGAGTRRTHDNNNKKLDAIYLLKK